jgi:hypothetical protein
MLSMNIIVCILMLLNGISSVVFEEPRNFAVFLSEDKAKALDSQHIGALFVFNVAVKLVVQDTNDIMVKELVQVRSGDVLKQVCKEQKALRLDVVALPCLTNFKQEVHVNMGLTVHNFGATFLVSSQILHDPNGVSS